LSFSRNAYKLACGPFFSDICLLTHSPTRVLLRVRTPTQSALQGENLDQLVSWQSSWQGMTHRWVAGGMRRAYRRHSPRSACVPSCRRHDTAGGGGGMRGEERRGEESRGESRTTVSDWYPNVAAWPRLYLEKVN